MQTIFYIGVERKMRFKLNANGEMALVGENIMETMRQSLPLSTALIVDIPMVKETIKKKGKNFLTNSNFAIAPFALGTVAPMESSGFFWDTFLTYIFPWMLDIAKVYCLVRIAQAFYEEKRGGKDSGTGFSALVQHGKWYLVFWLLPIGVELIDQVASNMFNQLQTKTIPTSR